MKVPINQIGIYSLGYNLGQYFTIFNTAIGITAGNLFLEYFAKNNLENELKARNLTFMLQGLILSIGIFAAIWIKEVFGILIKNKELFEAYHITAFIILSYTSGVMYYGAINKLIFLNRTVDLWKVTFIGAVLNIILNLILIPYIGIWGSVISTIVAGQYINLSGYYIKSFTKSTSVNYYPIYWLTIISMAYLLVILVIDANIIVKTFITISLVGLIFFMLKKNKSILAFSNTK